MHLSLVRLITAMTSLEVSLKKKNQTAAACVRTKIRKM